jgi:hypothetical protein
LEDYVRVYGQCARSCLITAYNPALRLALFQAEHA